MKKRILSSLLAILMLVSLLPMQVFAAEGEVTRIQWLQKLTETFDMTVEADNYPDNYYSDVSSDDSYYRDVMVATEFGLIDQEPGTELKPNEPATREFAAHTLNFCLGYELEEGATYTFADSASLTYADDAQVAVNRNWFALVDGKFMPEQVVTNSEMTAMLADAAAVLEGQEVDTGAQSEYTFADGVKEIPESASVTTSEDGSSLTIVGYTGTLKAGDIVAVHEVFPVIYSVTAVTSADGVLTLTVTKLDADDYIISMNTQGSVDADLSEVEAAEDTDITYIMSNGVETQSAARAQALLRDKKVKIKDVKLDKTLYNSGGIKVKVYGKLTSMNLTYNVKLGGNAPYAMVRVDGKASVGCSASFDSMESLELPSSITLAYVPVAGIGKIAVSAKVSLEGEVTLEYSTNFTAGFEYSKSSGFRAIKNFSTGSFSVQAQVDLKAGIEANAGLADIPFITGYVYIEAGARMKMYYSTVNSNTVKYCVDTSAYLYAKVGYYIGIKNVKTWSDSYEIWDMSNSPMKVHNHFENGVSTGGVCTVGSDCSNKGYGRNGYTTGANSRYYNYGGSNGSSKGTSSSGKPYTIYEYTLDDYKNAVITKYNGNVSALFVPKTIDGYTVVGIGSSAFEGNTNLRFLHLPETLTVIGYEAFRDCINLGTIDFPESLIEINGYAFYGCNGLTDIKLPSNLQTLKYESFGNCANLQSVWIPKTITNATSYNNSNYYYGPFDNCAKLKSVTFADGITYIPSGLFESCTGIESIEIPDTVTSINTYAFQNSSIRSVKVGSGLTTICSNAFYGCKNLTEINLPESLTVIGYEAFRDCINLGTIDFPESLIEIKGYAFYGCNSLTDIKLPSKITRIENYTFYGCSSMTTAELPEALKSIGEYAFYGCEALEGIVIPDKTYLIENDAFENCSALKSLKCGTGLRTVEYNAFRNCDALTEVALQEGVTTIGNNAFYDCDGLETIAIPNSVTSIGTSLFSGCEKLKNVTLGIGITQIPASMFYQCPKLESIALPYRVTSIGDSAFANSTSFTSITIPRSVTTFGSNIFSYPAKLTIYGVSGTKAEAYAGNIGATFVPIDKPATLATLDKTTLNINKGSSAKLNLSVQPIDFTDEVNWKSANTSVVTVAADGTVKAVGVGTTTIKVTVGNASASCKVTVVQPVTSISLNTTSLSMEALSTYQLTATAYPNDAYDKSVKWESSDTSVATVSENGLVTAVGKGTATIKATSTAVSSVSRSCTVTVTNNGIVAKDVAQLESPHNYSNNCSDIWLYTLPDASKITVTFDERTNIEDGFDYLYIYNASGEQVGKYTGTELAGKSIDIDGDTVKIKLVSDGGGNEWGFKVTDVKVASGAHVHSYTSVVTAPTCTEKGYTTHTCTCGDSYVDSYTDALGHSYGAWKQTKAPTCTAKGMETRTCTRCNASETRDINALGHDIVHHAAKAATCTEKGWAAYDTCSRCDYSTYKEIAATGHHHNAVVTAPTCTAKGYTTHTCACGNSYKDSYTNALGHNYANGKCTRCGAADPNYKPAPKAPGLKITTSAGKPKISWDAVDGAVKYWVYRSTDGKTFKYYDSTTKTTYTNNSTTIGTTYYYKVKAVNVVDGKNYASAYSVSKGIQCKPAAPTVSINRSNGKPKLSWKAVSGATKYWIYRSTDGVNFKYWDSTTKTSYTNSGAESGKKYYYRVKAVAVVNGKNIVSANSSTKSLFTSLAKPSVSITTSNGKPKLTWKAVTGADKYYIYRSTDGKNFSYWDSTTKTTYVNSGAKKNTKYYYKVKAVCASNSNANSAQSSTVSIKAAK